MIITNGMTWLIRSLYCYWNSSDEEVLAFCTFLVFLCLERHLYQFCLLLLPRLSGRYQ